MASDLETATAHLKAGRLPLAEAACLTALHGDPAAADALHLMATILLRGSRPVEAVEWMERAVKADPSSPSHRNTLGAALAQAGRIAHAAQAFEAAARLAPSLLQPHVNLVQALRRLERMEDAETLGRDLTRRWPQAAEAHNALGMTLHERGDVAGATKAFDVAVRLRPDYVEARRNLGLDLLILGDFERGWKEFEWRRRHPVYRAERDCSAPEWDGSDPAGKTILLHPEYGMGNTIQFVRYAPLLADRGAKVVLECPPPLSKLMRSVRGVQTVLPAGASRPPLDLHCPLLSLPLRFGTTLCSVPVDVPYLRADPALVAQWRERLAAIGGFKVGVNWQCDPTTDYGRRRTIAPEWFAKLAEVPGIRLVSLQKGATTVAAPTGLPILTLTGLDETAGPFMDTAAVMMNLDLVVSADTATAHLAGALGVPVWTALTEPPDWRWLLDRDDSPWYPTMRLFRQAKPGEWSGVFDRIAQALKARVA